MDEVPASSGRGSLKIIANDRYGVTIIPVVKPGLSQPFSITLTSGSARHIR